MIVAGLSPEGWKRKKGKGRKMERWLSDAKEAARIQAKCIAMEISDVANEHKVEKWWFFEEVLKHINRIKTEEEKKG